jgi:hypothetical protein
MTSHISLRLCHGTQPYNRSNIIYGATTGWLSFMARDHAVVIHAQKLEYDQNKKCWIRKNNDTIIRLVSAMSNKSSHHNYTIMSSIARYID